MIGWFNKRILFLCAISLLSGIAFSYFGKRAENALFLLAFFVIFALFAAYSFALAKENRIRFSEVLKPRVFSIVLAAICFLLGGVLFAAEEKRVGESEVLSGRIMGTVAELPTFDGIKFSVILEDVVVTGETGETHELSGRASVLMIDYADVGLSVDIGNHVSFNGTLYPNEIVNTSRINTYAYKHRLVATGTVDAFDVFVVEGELNLVQSIRKKADILLETGFSKGGKALASALLFGDKSELSSLSKEAFSRGGIAHVFAVSGLHVGFVSAIFLALCKRLRVHRVATFFLITLASFAYAALCGFSPSVLRACIMVSVLLAGRIFFAKSDLLSSASVAMILILCVRPLYAFDLGFLMSFSAIYGLALFSASIRHALRGLGTFLSSSLSASLSVTLAMIPILAFSIKEIPIFSFLVNVIAIPLVSAAFTVLFLVLAVSFVFPAASVLLVVPDVLLSILSFVANFSANTLPVIPVAFGFAGTVLAMVLLFFLSRAFLAAGKTRVIVTCVLSAIFLFVTVGEAVKPCEKNSIVFCSELEETVIFTDENGDGYLFVGNTSRDFDLSVLRAERLKNTTLIFAEETEFSKLYEAYVKEAADVRHTVVLNGNETVGPLTFTWVEDGLKISFYGIHLLKLVEITQNDLENIAILSPNADIIYTDNGNLDCSFFFAKAVISPYPGKYVSENGFVLNAFGRLQYIVKDGIMLGRENA